MQHMSDSDLSALFVVLCNIVATTSLVIWDTFLAFDEEVEFIWSSNFTFVKVLYFVVRYLGLIFHCAITLVFFGNIHAKGNSCFEITRFISIAGTITIGCSNILLIQRVYAFYGRSRSLLWSLLTLFVICEASVVAVLIVGVPRYRTETLEGFPPPFGHCTIENYSAILSLVWFLELMFQVVAFVCIVGRFARLQYMAWKTGVPNSQLYTVFLRDGIWVFFILFLCFLFSGIYMHSTKTAGLCFALWSFATSNICCTRLILNLNHSVNKDRDCGSSLWYY